MYNHLGVVILYENVMVQPLEADGSKSNLRQLDNTPGTPEALGITCEMLPVAHLFCGALYTGLQSKDDLYMAGYCYKYICI